MSWYEAAAYAAWLGQVTGKPYRLPTEAEWERAARHTDGRQFPWGDEWDANRANSKETNWGRPAVVGCFPGGYAVCGVVIWLAMCGNGARRAGSNEEGMNTRSLIRLKTAVSCWKGMILSRVLKGGGRIIPRSRAARCALRYHPRYNTGTMGFGLWCPHFSSDRCFLWPLISDPARRRRDF